MAQQRKLPRVPFPFAGMRKGPEAAPQGLRKSAKRSALGALHILQADKVRSAGGPDCLGELVHQWVYRHSTFPKRLT
jgi:hypothetical protein